ncbi:non-ribosomal peptide synthetase [Streptomyces lateritius]|uniref:non-ribosomal peptide synthetase n=1 Tax=Streptomyces lateritius TaxID=67313 RepID=UPI001678FD3B|nr:non-ribosomal peptide synthetase [Streptomyces lateritius]GGT72991.1 putative phenyloxazoline synthase MbtB [Streptomyces lateritius]
MLSIDDLRRVVTELLGPGSEPPGDHDNLIELGLDSLKLMRIADRCRRNGLDVGFADLARRPTLAGWAGLRAEAASEPEPEAATASAAGTTAPGERRVPGERGAAQGVPAADVRASDDPTTDAAATDEPFPLALMQHAYWVGRGGSQALGAVAAHLYTEFDGSGVDPARLGAAVAALAERHPMLRARILDDGRQVVGPWTRGTELPVLDLRDLSPQEAEEQAARLRDQLSHQLLDVEAGQVFDVRVTLLPAGRTRVHVDVDMLAADARSYRAMLADLVHLYENPGRPLPPLGYSYARYLAERRSQPPREQDVRWWRERLGELPGAPLLPTRPEAERGAGHRVTRLHHWLSPEQRGRLTDQARRHAVTPAIAAATAFAEVLGAWSGEPRFLLNVPMFDRRPLHPDVDRLVGDFTSSVLLDVDLTESRTFAERAADAQDRMHRAAQHSSYSGVEVLRDLSRHQGSQVLAPVVFTSALDLGELFGQDVERCLGEPVWIVSQGPQVLLDAQITELHDGLLVNWDVRADAFPDGVADAMFAAFVELIGKVSDGSAWDAPVGPLATREQLAVRAEVNRTDGQLPEHPLHHAFFTRAAATPDAPAVLGSDAVPGSGTTTVTYGQLAERALRVAGALRERGVQAGDAVAISLPKGPDQLVAVLGVHAAGGHYVPIGVEQPPARAESIRERAGVTVALTAPGSGTDAGHLPLDEAVAWPRPLAEPLFADPGTVAYVLFTSGSTGEPKGVEVSHRAAANTVDDLVERLGLGPADRVLALSALDFDLSVFDIFAPLAVGGAVVTVDEATRKDASAWARLVHRHSVTVLNCVPGLLDMLLTAAGSEPLGTSLRAVLLGGDWVGVDLPVRLHAQVPGCRFLGLGGTTETAIHSTVREVEGGEVPARWTSVPYGTPLRNVRCRAVDAQGRDCPDWVPGELWIGGAGVADGYRGDAERTADRFVETDGVRWYRTGDRARYWPDGTLEFLGRADDQVKIRGFRIELGEVEAALAEHPAVRHAAALVIRTGPTPRLCAVVAADAGTGPGDVRARAADRLPAHMLPDTIAVLDDMPLTANGKVDRRALRELLAVQAKEGEREAPASALEEVVARTWGRVLDAEKVGRHDDYFQLGGDSILATRITARLREALDTEDVSVHDVLASLTVAGLARTLLDRDEEGRLELVAEVFLEIDSLTDEEIDAQLDDGPREPERADG